MVDQITTGTEGIILTGIGIGRFQSWEHEDALNTTTVWSWQHLSFMVTSWCCIWLVRMVLGEVLQHPVFCTMEPMTSPQNCIPPSQPKMEALSVLSDIQYTSDGISWNAVNDKGGGGSSVRATTFDTETRLSRKTWKVEWTWRSWKAWCSEGPISKRRFGGERFFKKNSNPTAQLIGRIGVLWGLACLRHCHDMCKKAEQTSCHTLLQHCRLNSFRRMQ